MPPLASARIIDLQAARLALARDADRAPPATLGAVPPSFRQWHGELRERAPRFRWSAWAAAGATHAIICAAILLYAVFTKLPEPLPGIAVTLSFEPAKPAGEPSPAPPIEATTTETTPDTPPTEMVPREPMQVLPSVDPMPPEPAVTETPLAAAPEIPQPVAAAPPPPIPRPRPLPPQRRPAKPATPVKHRTQSAEAAAPAGAPTGATTAGTADTPPATLVAPKPPQAEQLSAIPPTQALPVPGNRKPDYPMVARIGHVQGRLVLRVEVTDSGSAAAVAVAVSSGHAVLDDAAVAAVRAWRFVPATKGGVPVAGIAMLPIQFRLED
jgi:protein TonB